jgi:hypothetical protein
VPSGIAPVGNVTRPRHDEAVDVTASLTADVEPRVLFDTVADLGGYPDWLDIVPRADPLDPASGDVGPAWSVDLRGRVGPLSRSKRLRMVRTHHEPSRLAVFERRELDGRSHSDWVLRARVHADPHGSSTLTMELHYGGSMWVPMLDRLLADEIERSRTRLLQVLGSRS